MSTQVPEQPSNPALERLRVFVGEWNIEITSMSFLPDPSAVERGHTSFDWLEGGAFLIQHSEISNPDWPRSIAAIGPDDGAGTYHMLYFDSRGISRIYQMSLSEDTWKLWRDFLASHNASSEPSAMIATPLAPAGRNQGMARTGNWTLS